MRDQSIETEKKRKRIGERERGGQHTANRVTNKTVRDGWRRKGEEGWGWCTVPSVSNLEANFPIKRPGRQDNCSSDVTLDSAGVWNRALPHL